MAIYDLKRVFQHPGIAVCTKCGDRLTSVSDGFNNDLTCVRCDELARLQRTSKTSIYFERVKPPCLYAGLGAGAQK